MDGLGISPSHRSPVLRSRPRGERAAASRCRNFASVPRARSSRREFTPEFKREAVALLESSGRPQTQIAAELGIQLSMLRSWRAIQHGGQPRSRAGQAAGSSAAAASSLPSPADQAAEIARLKRELDRTRMERDILKKAIGIFSETPK